MGIDVWIQIDGEWIGYMDSYKGIGLESTAGYLRNPICSFSDDYPDEVAADFFQLTPKLVEYIRSEFNLDRFLSKYLLTREAISKEWARLGEGQTPGDADNAARNIGYRFAYFDQIKYALQRYLAESPDAHDYVAYVVPEAIELIEFLRVGYELQLAGYDMTILYA